MRPDLTDPAFLADPAPVLARLRAAGPLVEVRVPLVGRVRLTTTDAAARALLKDPRFRRDPKAVTGRSMAQTLWFLPRFLAPVLDSVILKDGRAHHRLRTRVERAFGRATIEDLAPEIGRMADRLLDGLDPVQPVDLVPRFCRPLPLLAISALLGVPDNERERISRWIGPLSAPRAWTLPASLPGLWRLLRHFRADIAAAAALATMMAAGWGDSCSGAIFASSFSRSSRTSTGFGRPCAASSARCGWSSCASGAQTRAKIPSPNAWAKYPS